MSKIIFVIMLVGALCISANSYAVNYYMSPTGSNDNTGRSIAEAWATLQHARSIGLSAGDTLFIMGGVYTAGQYFHDLSGDTQGSPGNPVVFKAYGDDVAVFTGTGHSDAYYRSYFSFEMRNFAHIVIDGYSYLDPDAPLYLKLEGHEDSANLISVQANPGYHCDYFTIRGVEIDGNHGDNRLYHGIKLTYARYTLVEGCYIHHILLPTGDYQDSGECMFVRSSEFVTVRDCTMMFSNHGLMAMERARPDGHPTRYCKIQNNVFDNGWGGGLYVNMNSYYNLVEGNIFAHCGGSTGYPKPPIQLSGSNNSIRKNIFYNPDNQGMVMNAQSFQAYHYVVNNNLVYNNTYFSNGYYNLGLYASNTFSPDCSLENNLIKNNIFYRANGPWNTECPGSFECELRADIYTTNDDHNWTDPDGQGLFPDNGHWGGNAFQNNVIRYDSQGLDKETLFIFARDANEGGGCWTYSVTELEAGADTSWADNIGSDPMLLSETPDNPGVTSNWWYIREGSPCIDRGEKVHDYNGEYMRDTFGTEYGWYNLTWKGTRPDIGAYEHDSENPAPPVVPPGFSMNPGKK